MRYCAFVLVLFCMFVDVIRAADEPKFSDASTRSAKCQPGKEGCVEQAGHGDPGALHRGGLLV